MPEPQKNNCCIKARDWFIQKWDWRWLFSILAVLLIVLGFFKPDAVNSTTVTLVLVAMIPILPSLLAEVADFFESIRYKSFEAKFRQQSGETDPLPAVADIDQLPKGGEELSNAALKVIATLWYHQKDHFKEDFSKRWTFIVPPASPDFPEYLSGVSELMNRKFSVVHPKTGHCLLTDEGISYCEKSGKFEGVTRYRF